ncbi:Hypothetical protein PBC10988_31720 [Planctomycetales bacterium 10988]|nr:Hypothetical protein PBC10988_31720 [Planctomycetales bacterium 10988]
MIFSKIWHSIASQMNKLANYLWTVDPIAQMQYEYDRSVEDLKTGREGLVQYRALVERVQRQVLKEEAHIEALQAKIKRYLSLNDRETASKFALELQRSNHALVENKEQLAMHEQAYENNLLKIKHASKQLESIKQKIKKYDAELKMSRAESELAELAENFNFEVTTDFGRIEDVIQDQIGVNQAKAKVAADLSSTGLDEIRQEQALEASMAEDALLQFEKQMGLITQKEPVQIEETPATEETEK